MKYMTSKITARGQATIPAEIRRILNVSIGDRVAFKVGDGNKVELTRATPLDFEYAEALEPTLEAEWLSEEDEEAYGNL